MPNEKTLRSSLIRLALAKPELRGELLPLLSKSAAEHLDVDGVVDGTIEVKKGDKIDFTYQGEKVVGKVVRVKRDAVTVDVEGHSDEDVGWVDIRLRKKAG